MSKMNSKTIVGMAFSLVVLGIGIFGYHLLSEETGALKNAKVYERTDPVDRVVVVEGKVSGKNKTTFSEMIALDVRYAETKSPWFDLKIMFKTFPALLSQVIESRFKKKADPAPSHQRRVLDDSYVCDTSPDESPDRAATALQENSRRMEIATTAHAEN